MENHNVQQVNHHKQSIFIYVIQTYCTHTYIYIYSWWCNNHLEKYEFVNGKDDNPYIMENKSHVPNHQPYIYIYT